MNSRAISALVISTLLGGIGVIGGAALPASAAPVVVAGFPNGTFDVQYSLPYRGTGQAVLNLQGGTELRGTDIVGYFGFNAADPKATTLSFLGSHGGTYDYNQKSQVLTATFTSGYGLVLQVSVPADTMVGVVTSPKGVSYGSLALTPAS